MSEWLLEVQGLRVRYRQAGQDAPALDGVDLTVAPGETVAVVGESGSGKSTLALAVTRLLPAHRVRVEAQRLRFEGRDVLSLPEPQLRALRGGKIAYVFQEPATSLNPVLTIGEQLREAIELHAGVRGPAAGRLAGEWLSRVGLGDGAARLNAYPHEFAGGIQQRVMIAMAMACTPALLIADEPTSALDVTVQVQILRLLRELQARYQLALLLISHDLLVVRRLARRVMVLERGRVVEAGLVDQVLERPAHPYTQRLLEARRSMSWRGEVG